MNRLIRRWIDRAGARAPRLVLGASLGLTILASGLVYSSIRRERNQAFHAATEEIASRVAQRLERYENALIQTRALFATEVPVSRAVFRDYIQALGIFDRYPGIQGIGYVARVPSKRMVTHLSSVRREGVPDYRVWPESPARAEYFPIVYLEPFDWRNQRALGYDMMTEATRREAMIRARDEGTPAMTSRVRLVQETHISPQPGFLLYVPMYEQGRPIETPEQRRAALTGYIYSPYRAGDFFQALIRGEFSTDLAVDLEVFSGESPDRPALLYDQDGVYRAGSRAGWSAAFRRAVVLRFGGSSWLLAMRSVPGFVPANLRYAPLAVALVGTLLSLLFFAIAKAIHDQLGRERGAQRIARESEARYELASRATKNAIWAWDLEAGSIRWNKAIQSEYGYPAECAITDVDWWYQRIHEVERERVVRGIREAIDSPSESLWMAEYRFQRADGSYAMVLDRGYVERDERGKARRMIGAMEDVTERHRLERELLTKSEALEHSLNGFDIVGEDGTFLYVNRAYLRMWGYERAEEVLGTSPAGHCVDPETPMRIIRELKDRGECEIEFLARRKDGSTFDVRMWARRAHDPQGREIYPSSSIDVTEHRRIEEERARLLRQVQESVRARDEFLSIASHELKTPITSLKLQFQLTARRLERGDRSACSEESVRKRVATANRQLDRLARLIEDMLDVSRISLGKLALRPERLDLVPLVREVVERFADQLHAAGIEAECELPPGPIWVCADRHRTEQVLENLLTNAMKYGEGKPVRLSVAATERGAELRIQDQGMGIARENWERVFQRFERAVDKSSISGLGIGLFICRQILEAQGGKIRVESELGKGSTFVVELPSGAAG